MKRTADTSIFCKLLKAGPAFYHYDLFLNDWHSRSLSPLTGLNKLKKHDKTPLNFIKMASFRKETVYKKKILMKVLCF
jgi:hypothetical protein